MKNMKKTKRILPLNNQMFRASRLFMVFEDSPVVLYGIQKINFPSLILKSLWASENGQNLLTKMASEGVK